MNNQLIKEIISSNNETCPEFVYQNPLLDKNVTNALSKSFMKILKISDQNSSSNNNLRLSILENIRKVCRPEPEGHSKVDDSFTHFLSELYKTNIDERSNKDSVDKKLDAFLLRTITNMDLTSSFQSTVSPEVIQALINLNDNGVYLDTLSKDVIHWNIGGIKYDNILNQLWNHCTNGSNTYCDDISVKMKPQIEMMVLNVCNSLLTTKGQDHEMIFENDNDLKELLNKCFVSNQCFQMCSGILNFLFIMTNFDPELQKFIPEFAKRVRKHRTFATELYPFQFSSVVLLLDIDLNILPEYLKDQYIHPTIKCLKELHERCENDLILVLSHFPQWFDIYFSEPNLKTGYGASSHSAKI